MADATSFFLTWMGALVITIFVHELGHAVFGTWAGYVVTSFGLGLGRPWLVVPVRGVRFYWGLARPLQGITFAYPPRLFPKVGPSILFFAGGIITNLLTAAVFFALWWLCTWGGVVWLTFGAANACVGLVNMVPFHKKIGRVPLRTDGALIVELLRSGAIHMPVSAVVQTLGSLRNLWMATGDVAMLRLCTVSAASAWLELGDTERARELIEEEERLPAPRSPYVAALLSLVRAQIAIKRQDVEEAMVLLDQASEFFQNTDQRDALFFVEVVREGAARACGAGFDDAKLLALSESEQVKTRRMLQAIWFADRLLAACKAGDAALVVELLPRFESAARRWPSDCRDLGVYAELSRFFEERGDLEQADRAHERKLLTLQKLALSWTDPAERARFLVLQEGALEKTRAYFEARGRHAEVAWFAEATGQQSAVVMADQRNIKRRSRAKWGFRLNVLMMICSFFAVLKIGPESVGSIGMIPFLFAFFVALSTIYRLVDFTIARWIPPLKRAGGTVLLTLAWMPWIAGLCLGLLVLIVRNVKV